MKENKRLPLILILSLPVLLILSTEMSGRVLNIIGQPIYLITFIYPLTFLISALISKKSESKVAINLVILALIIQCCIFVLKWVLFGKVDYILMEVTFLGFFMSHFILLLGYEVLKEINKIDIYKFIILILLIVTIIETMFYIIIYEKITIISLIITFVIKIIYDLIIAKILTR